MAGELILDTIVFSQYRLCGFGAIPKIRLAGLFEEFV
jgi:hypothetical protein